MGPTPPVALPPVTAEYASTLKQAESKLAPAQSSYKFSRAGDGKTRVDSGNTSVISNPATGQSILLDHLKKTATVQPAPPPAPPAPGMPNPAMPKMPGFSPPTPPGQPPAIKVEDLGKTFMQGHEVEGKRITTPPPPPPAPPKPPAFQVPGLPPGLLKAPKIPGMPPLPKAPQIPGMPPPPKAPQMAGKPPGFPAPPPPAGPPPPPPAPPPPHTTEVWTSTKMGVPILTKMSGGFGQLTQVCKKAVPGEPHPSAFQIPQGYKVTAPPPPKMAVPPQPKLPVSPPKFG